MTEIKRDFVADRAICNAATAGPWVADGFEREEDALFIAEARTGWPAALAEIERLSMQLDVAVTGFRQQADLAHELIGKESFWRAEFKVHHGEIVRLQMLISRLRCAECGDKLGEHWAEEDGIAVCGFCKSEEEEERQ